MAHDPICPECGKSFQAPVSARGGRPPTFCSVEHQGAFRTRNAARGKQLLPFTQVWAGGRHGPADARRYALSQATAMLAIWNAEDRKAGRRPDVIVSAKAAAKWRAADLP